MVTLPPVIPALITFLTANTDADVVSVAVPQSRPPKFITVTAAGGNRRNLAQADPLIVVKCWATSSLAAMDLAEAAWSALDATNGAYLTPEVWVDDIQYLSLPIDQPDTATGSPRWQFNFQPTVSLEES